MPITEGDTIASDTPVNDMPNTDFQTLSLLTPKPPLILIRVQTLPADTMATFDFDVQTLPDDTTATIDSDVVHTLPVEKLLHCTKTPCALKIGADLLLQ